MQSFEEAFKTLLQTVDDYVSKYCTENGQIRSNISAFIQNKTSYFLGLFPIGYEQTKVSGEAGYDNAREFKKFMTQIKSRFSNDTHELIKYLFTQYEKPEENNSNFNKTIWRAIRIMAGFSKIHINYLSEQYLNAYKPNRNDNGFGINQGINQNDLMEAKNKAKHIIHEAITGKYHKLTIECLSSIELSKENSDIILKTPRAYCEIFDCGQLLLNTLEAILNPNRNQNLYPIILNKGNH